MIFQLEKHGKNKAMQLPNDASSSHAFIHVNALCMFGEVMTCKTAGSIIIHDEGKVKGQRGGGVSNTVTINITFIMKAFPESSQSVLPLVKHTQTNNQHLKGDSKTKAVNITNTSNFNISGLHIH